MADLPEPDTHPSSDTPAPPDSSDTPAATRRTRVLQIIAGALIVAALVLLLRGLLTPAAPTGATPGHATSSPAATATAAPADPLVGHYAPDVTLRDLRDKLY